MILDSDWIRWIYVSARPNTKILESKEIREYAHSLRFASRIVDISIFKSRSVARKFDSSVTVTHVKYAINKFYNIFIIYFSNNYLFYDFEI